VIRSRRAADHGARTELSSFVGRQHELTRISQLLAEAPLVTLAGPGGAGKTRLATRVCREMDGARDVVVVELAPVGDPSRVPSAVAAALGVAEDSRQALPTRLADTLGGGHLLVLDNCEHVVEACAQLVDMLLRACEGLRVLATSREPLGIEGEAVFRVPPLGLPASDDLETCAESEAVQLFLQRARAARDDFQLNVGNASQLARLCRQLGGLPLALELAAARVASLPLDDIVVRLEGTTRLLSGGPRSAPPRQQTIEAAIAWSYNLLAEDECRLFDRLSVFAGGFALDQAEALVPAGADVVELLGRLVTRSMVQLELSDEPDRYRLLEPLRQFGRNRLLEQDALDETCRQHAQLMLTLVERAGRELQGARQLESYQRLDLEWDNVRAALDWAETANDAEMALRLAAPLQFYWSRPDRQAEGRARLERLLSIAGAEHYAAEYARVLGTLATLTLMQGDLARGTPLTDRALVVARAQSDRWLEANMLRNQGMLKLFGGELAESELVLAQALDLARRADLHVLESALLGDMASLAVARGAFESAEESLRSALRLKGLDAWSRAMTFNGLGDVLRARGDAEGAAAAYAQARPVLEAMNGGRRTPSGMLHNLGYLELARDNSRVAARLFLEAADGYRKIGHDRRGLAECVMGLAAVAVRLRQPHLAARLFGAAESTLDQLGTTMTPTNRADYDRARAELAACLPPDQVASFEAAGRLLDLEPVLELARLLAAPDAPASTRPAGGLTARELEVAQLLARGLRNRQIADALVITDKTAANHVQRVLDKLGVGSRAEIAARADELGLSDRSS
jgi:non-specific serine/threonine protein kinase